MCLPFLLQKPTDDSPVSDEELAPEEQSDEDNIIYSVSENDSSSASSIGNTIIYLIM